MNHFLKGITYSYNRNIGWPDRTIRTVVGIAAAAGAYYFSSTNATYTLILFILAVAQAWTVISAKCIICYFARYCTITKTEKQQLDSRGILHG